jgi:hypothetical protein
MAIGAGSILVHKMFANLDGQQILNVQYYEVLSTVGAVVTLSGFALPFGEKFVNKFKPHQTTALAYIRTELYEVNGVEMDVYAFAPGVTGNASGDYLPTFNCYAIRQNRSTRITRNGQKRIAGVPESAQTNGVVAPATVNALANAAANLWVDEVLYDDDTQTGRQLYVQGIIWGGNSPQYPLGRYQIINSCTVNNRITSQNTRKIRTRDGV